jgi:hypothetical protein
LSSFQRLYQYLNTLSKIFATPNSLNNYAVSVTFYAFMS